MKKWNLKTLSSPQSNDLIKEMKISDSIGQILINRNIDEKEKLDMYINPKIESLRNPFLLKDMDKAVSRIKDAISRKEKIVIYGDYDVDGVSSTSILLIYFNHVNYPVDFYIPNRLEEGYGLNIEAIDHIKEMGANLIITVDCGITSVEEVEYAKEKSIDVIISDHHEPQEELPRAVAVIDPKREDCKYPFKGICGCGVAFKLIHALSGDEDFFANINLYLEIVALATICDVMPVLDENRIIVKNGMEIMGKGANKGMEALIKVCAIDKEKLRSSHLGFAIGPRINASGRLGFSRLGVELFIENDSDKAFEIAELMNLKNQERQDIESYIYNQVEDRIRSDKSYSKDKVLVLSGRGWHHGIIGIVASKITEKYYKPTILLCSDEDGIAVGSARSIKGFDIFSALCKCSDLMMKFGGHEQAAGMTMEETKVEELRKIINEIADYRLEEQDLIENIGIEYMIKADDLTLDLEEELHILEPFGIRNPTPYFMMQECLVKAVYYMGKDKKHIKLIIENGKEFDCVGFGLAHLLNDFEVGDLIDIVFTINKNTYMGNTKLQLMIKDIKLNKPCNMKNNIYLNEKIYYMLLNKINSEKNDEYLIKNMDMCNEIKENKFFDQKKEILSRKIKREENILSQYQENTLVLYNTIEGYCRSKSDSSLLEFENVELAYLSNIDKYDIKVYNKIIIYDYFYDLDELLFIYCKKNKDTEVIMNFGNQDFIYLNKSIRNMEFDRDEFVVIYKHLMGINEDKITYSKFIKSQKFSPLKIMIILETFKNAQILNYKINYENDILCFNFLPKPAKKLSLEENSVVIKLKNIIKKYNVTYGN
ncbi:single-stranded-DNA-specific exonuclease RecJ [Peptostreptococcus equinus]|uniref:Single-stranded-DNA-specific exonuclease RecJ n=1 Tax=Peptostreptococcus equinus TaxID=3003601 RepID=A0ABY7JV19_9FIRM|nr:single-stranded-DNA-specific exonuclease RecJ [Peptostreptococcus sp. CBA3647]WAW15562.1 single-stranded-DNA-specific exonuclease RecJ [Peptostreptococcus sp. CBA3647]